LLVVLLLLFLLAVDLCVVSSTAVPFCVPSPSSISKNSSSPILWRPSSSAGTTSDEGGRKRGGDEDEDEDDVDGDAEEEEAGVEAKGGSSASACVSEGEDLSSIASTLCLCRLGRVSLGEGVCVGVVQSRAEKRGRKAVSFASALFGLLCE